jgi:hypothetical protein
MAEVRYDKSHHAGATAEERIHNGLKSSGGHGHSTETHPTRTHTHIHMARRCRVRCMAPVVSL